MPLSIEVQDNASPAISYLASRLRSRAPLHRWMGREVVRTIKGYLIDQAQTRHATARGLGAAPTGHLGMAAKKTALSSVDDDAATISINQPGMIRALRDVDIVPTGGRTFLAIPARKESYGRTPKDFSGLRFVPTPRGGMLVQDTSRLQRFNGSAFRSRDGRFATAADTQEGLTWFFLVRRVHQRQDRTLLPSDDALRRAGAKGAQDFVAAMLARKEGGS